MNTEEFSNGFDTLINSYANTPEFGKVDSLAFNEYEKSLFLTKAQEDIVQALYSGKTIGSDSFESTEENRRYLDSLIRTETLEEQYGENKVISTDSKVFQLPSDLWYITYESVNTSDSSIKDLDYISVIPITQDEYHRVKNNPFRMCNERRVLRLDYGEGKVELISKFNIDNYTLRYLAKPEPIILINLPEDLTIDGISEKTDCKLNPAIHNKILERAVALALASKAGSK